MRVLGFDASTEYLTMAVVEDEQVAGELTVRDARGPVEQLVVLLARFLKQLGLSVWDMDGFAVGVGPGSWTGTRVAATTGKVLAFATEKPISGVSSFDALVYGTEIQDDVISVLSDFGRDRMFTATYEIRYGIRKRVTEYEVIRLEDVLTSTKTRTIFVGRGALRHRRALSALGDLAILSHVGYPTGQWIASLGLKSLVVDGGDDPFTLTPVYVAMPQSETVRQTGGV